MGAIIITLGTWILKVLKPKLKGIWGEKKVALKLKLLSSKKYKVLNNVLIQTETRSSQLDHIIVSNYGIFVIETKNYSGWIFGHEYTREWTQTLYKRKHKFRNPIKQSKAHIRTLKDVLGTFGSIPYYPIIVFNGNATLKRITSSVPVIYGGRLLRCIKKHSNTVHLSDQEVDQIYQKIIQLNRKDRASRKLHIAKAKSYRN